MENTIKEAKKVGIIGIVFNSFLLIIKLSVGILFKSQGLISDALNSFGDSFSSLITFVGVKISEKPADEDHEFGHGKAEFVASFLIGIFMIIVSIETAYNGLMSVILKERFIFSVALIIAPIVTIITKLYLLLYCKTKSKKYKSLLIASNEKDHRNDMLISIGVIIGIIFGYFGYYFVDGIIGVIISCIIAATGMKITKEAYDVLIDKCIDLNSISEMKKKILEVDGINHIDSIKSKPTGNLHIIIVKISVDPLMTVRESHIIAGKVREVLKGIENVYDAVVHINPDE